MSSKSPNPPRVFILNFANPCRWLRLRQREAIFDETKPEVQMTAWVKNKATGKFEKLTQTVKWDR